MEKILKSILTVMLPLLLGAPCYADEGDNLKYGVRTFSYDNKLYGFVSGTESKVITFAFIPASRILTAIYNTPKEYPIRGIGNSAFANCTLLSGVVFRSEYMLEIHAHAFEGCTKLKSIELPRCVRTIEKLAFYGCRA